MKRNILCLLALIFFPLSSFSQDEWEARNNGLNDQRVYALCASPADNRVIFAGTEAGLFRSQNSGENWALIEGGLPAHGVWVSDDGRTVMVVRGWGSRSDGLWMSQNGGNDFNVRYWAMYPTAIAVNPENNNQIFMGTDHNGVYFTLNGNDWNQANNGLGGGAVSQLAFKNVDDDCFIFAADAGGMYVAEVANNIRWEETGPHGLPVRQFAFSFRDEETVFAGTYDESDSDGLYVSDNLGDGWEPLYWCFYVEAVEDCPGALIFASSEVGVRLQIEGREDWMELNDGLPEATITDLLLTIDPDGNQLVLYASTNGAGVFRIMPSTDRDLTVALHEGWNMISINVLPGLDMYVDEEAPGPDVILMTDQLRDGDEHALDIIKDVSGRFYIPAWDFNNIPCWDHTHGYMAKMNFSVETVWSGEPIPFDADLPLNDNWNMVAYYPDYQLSAAAPEFYVLASIIDQVVIAKDIAGRFLSTSWEFSNMLPWRETQGYMIKM